MSIFDAIASAPTHTVVAVIALGSTFLFSSMERFALGDQAMHEKRDTLCSRCAYARGRELRELMQRIRSGDVSLDEAYEVRDDPYARHAEREGSLARLEQSARIICSVADTARTWLNTSLVTLAVLAVLSYFQSWAAVNVAILIIVGFQLATLLGLRVLTVRMLRVSGHDAITGVD